MSSTGNDVPSEDGGRDEVDVKPPSGIKTESDSEFDEWLRDSTTEPPSEVKTESTEEGNNGFSESISDTDVHIQVLRNLLENCKKEKDQSIKEIVELKQKLAKSTEDNTKVQTKLDECLSNNEELKSKNGQLEKDSEAHKKRTKLQTATIKSLKSDVSRCRKDRENLEVKVKEMKKERDDRDAELVGLKKERMSLEKELDRCKDNRNALELDIDQHRMALVWLMCQTKKSRCERHSTDNVVEEEGLSTSTNGVRNGTSRNEESEDIGCLVQKMEQFKLERDRLSDRVKTQDKIINNLQADLDRSMSDTANRQVAEKSPNEDTPDLRQALLRCQQEKEELQSTLARSQLDLEILQSRVKDHEAGKEHTDKLSALLKTALDESEWQRLQDRFDSRIISGVGNGTNNQEEENSDTDEPEPKRPRTVFF